MGGAREKSHHAKTDCVAEKASEEKPIRGKQEQAGEEKAQIDRRFYAKRGRLNVAVLFA